MEARQTPKSWIGRLVILMVRIVEILTSKSMLLSRYRHKVGSRCSIVHAKNNCALAFQLPRRSAGEYLSQLVPNGL
jgi:hypothetical protein